MSDSPSHRALIRPVWLCLLLALVPCVHAQGLEGAAALGKRLFFDPNLSASRRQACASCHDPSRAFTDPAGNGVGGAASLGADGRSLGDRNAPMLTYAAATPEFHQLDNGVYAGGLFLDGRAHDLETQAGMPMVDPTEMALAGTAEIASRLKERPDYLSALAEHFGADAASDAQLVAAAQAAIASYERSVEFFAYDSRYDRHLAGQYDLTATEAIGRELFFSDLTNCRHCHLEHPDRVVARETFSNYRYFNIGVPANQRVRAANALGSRHVDIGLQANPAAAGDQGQRGKFRVPSLRNVAVTGPYMHNGVFRELETAVLFYGRHLVDRAVASVNPETGRVWRPPEVAATVEGDLLRLGQPLDQQRVDQLVAFLKTLTDRRYEHLLK